MSVNTAITLSSTDTNLPSAALPGLSRYTGLREMARGGAGLLQSGLDVVTGRTVAIKTLLPDNRWSKKHRRRLLREARVTAQLQHPGVVPVYDIGEDEEAGLFFTMKRISGENLFQILMRIAKQDADAIAAFPLRRRMEVIADACQALHYAHVRGVIHRDLKPSNIWVGNFGEVTLLDWGAAKVWGQPDHFPADPTLTDERNAAPSTQQSKAIAEPASYPGATSEPANGPLTMVDQLLGTPLYMSPEQIHSSANLDFRSDVFSAGACLYEAMAIREAFRGASREETIDNVCERQPRPPSERSPQQGIPAEADRIVEKAIQKNAAMRYSSMREFVEAVRELASTLPRS